MSTQPYVIDKLVNEEKDIETSPPTSVYGEKTLTRLYTSLSLPASFEQFLSFLILTNESSIPHTWVIITVFIRTSVAGA